MQSSYGWVGAAAQVALRIDRKETSGVIYGYSALSMILNRAHWKHSPRSGSSEAPGTGELGKVVRQDQHSDPDEYVESRPARRSVPSGSAGGYQNESGARWRRSLWLSSRGGTQVLGFCIDASQTGFRGWSDSVEHGAADRLFKPPGWARVERHRVLLRINVLYPCVDRPPGFLSISKCLTSQASHSFGARNDT